MSSKKNDKGNLKSQYDFIVCGSGSSGSVVARRLAENPEVSVLLLEAGGDDDVPSVNEAHRWFENLGTDRDWKFVAQPNPHLRGRAIPLGMGKVLGGGSSINALAWARGHQHDWDFFAAESGDAKWGYESVLDGIHNLRIADGSIMPRVTTGNTMAPCIVIGERAGEILRAAYGM